METMMYMYINRSYFTIDIKGMAPQNKTNQVIIMLMQLLVPRF